MSMIGAVLADRYEIIEVIGEGGMGIVYKAKHALMDRIVAIKMLHEDYAANATALKRFEQEAKAVSSLNHPNILGVYDFGTNEKGQPFLVTEFLVGESLESILASKGRLPHQIAVPIFVQACVGLFHAHTMGVIHRDLKPSNLMLIDYEGTNSFVKILDFGIAKVMGGEDMKVKTPELTRTGEIFGSPLYMSPEQCKALPLDSRSDIYSLGCLMYRALTGECAINGNNLLEVLYKQVNEQPAAFDEKLLEEQTAVNVEKVIFKAMAKEPVDRYQSMSELKDALLHAVERGAKGLSTTGGIMPFSTSVAQDTNPGVVPLEQSQAGPRPSTSQSNVPAFAKASLTGSNVPITSLFSGPGIAERAVLEKTGPIKCPPDRRPLILGTLIGLVCAGIAAFFFLNYKQPQSVRDANSARLVTEATELYRKGKYSEALSKARIARELAQVNAQETDKSEDVLPLMAQIYLALGDSMNASATNLMVISRENSQGRDLSAARINANRRLARSALLGGDIPTARRFNERAISLTQRAYGYDAPALFEPYLLQAEIEILDGKLADARTQFDWLAKHHDQIDGKLDDDGARYLRDQANFTLASGDAVKAEQYAREGLKIMEVTYGPGNPETSSYQLQLGEALLAQHKLEESEKYVRQARESLEAALGKDNVRLIPVLYSLAKIRVAHDDLNGAGRACEHILKIGSSLYDSDYRMAKVHSLYRTILDRRAKATKPN